MWQIFPPKDLEKIRCSKIRMRRFFFLNFFHWNNKSLYFTFLIPIFPNKHFQVKHRNVVYCFIPSFNSINNTSFFCRSILLLVNYKSVEKNSFKYILRLLAGKFGWICTEFPLATFSKQIFTSLPLNFSAKSEQNNISCKKNSDWAPNQRLLLEKKFLIKFCYRLCPRSPSHQFRLFFFLHEMIYTNFKR